MNIFSTSPAKKYHDEAKKALQEGNPRQGLSQLTFGFCADPSHKPLYELAILCLQQFEDEAEEVNLFKAALSSFDDPHVFYDLGYHFIDVGHDRLAIPFLERAHLLDPSAVEVATELAIAYAGQFQPRKGRDALARVSYQQHFWAAYQYCWCSLLCNETEGVEDYIVSARRDIPSSKLDAEVIESCMVALDKLEEVLRRLIVISKPKPIIQHWHFIQYGSAVLDYFDDRVDPNGLSVAGGRWVATWGSIGEVISIIRKLELFLKELDRHPQVVLGLPDRDSQIISHAVSQVLGIPCEEATENNIARPDSLVVAADN
jgi:tetratricopeptide (TPR) repeat protein